MKNIFIKSLLVLFVGSGTLFLLWNIIGFHNELSEKPGVFGNIVAVGFVVIPISLVFILMFVSIKGISNKEMAELHAMLSRFPELREKAPAGKRVSKMKFIGIKIRHAELLDERSTKKPQATRVK